MKAFQTFSRDLDLFSDPAAVFVNEADSNPKENLWTEDSGLDTLEDLFVNNDLDTLDDLLVNDDPFVSDIDESDLTEQISNANDLLATDYNLLVDNSDNCGFMTSPPSRNRARSGVCRNPDDELSDAITTDAQIKRYWCSESGFLAFGNIPVCKKSFSPTRPSEDVLQDRYGIFNEAPLGAGRSVFVHLEFCILSKFDSFQFQIGYSSHVCPKKDVQV